MHEVRIINTDLAYGFNFFLINSRTSENRLLINSVLHVQYTNKYGRPLDNLIVTP